MNRNKAFMKICDKIDCSPDKVIQDIKNSDIGTRIRYGRYTLVCNYTVRHGIHVLYHLYLYKNDTLETSFLADIK